ncbi:hypothetical protein TNCV_2387361 [Trichonephila clavipes]|nr:hypothetical protein TNCV_2387361 [Trichonephila clavipes]
MSAVYRGHRLFSIPDAIRMRSSSVCRSSIQLVTDAPLASEEVFLRNFRYGWRMHPLLGEGIGMTSEKMKTPYDAEQPDTTSMKATKCDYGIKTSQRSFSLSKL